MCVKEQSWIFWLYSALKIVRLKKKTNPIEQVIVRTFQ